MLKQIHLKHFLILILILGIALFFRLLDVNWDQNFHLHPDERFLTMVGAQFHLPKNFFQYINPATSSMNPAVLGFSFFVYGVFPITLNFLISLIAHTQTYNLFTIQGRILSGLFDTGTVVIIFLITFALEKKIKLFPKVKYFAALFYAIAVLPIQLSHFFTVDIFLSFFMLLSFYFVLLFSIKRHVLYIIFSGTSLGIALACKATGLAILPLELFFLILPLLQHTYSKTKTIVVFLLYTFFTYISLRLADPYLFQSANFFDLRINTTFLQSIKTLASYDNPHIIFPPSIQWGTKLPIIFSLTNIALFGLGIGIFCFCLLGIFLAVKKKNIFLIAPSIWVILFFLYQSSVFVKTMRYFIFLYPFFAIFAGIGFTEFIRKRNKVTILVSIFLIIFWPCMFLSIYTKPQTRVVATQWIQQHVQRGNTILGEYWDDPLPLASGNTYNIVLMHVFDADTKEKWNIINDQLAHAGYLVLSSNRGWGSIPTEPNKYPLMSQWYKDLFSGKLSYQQVAEFTSYPSLSYLGIPLTMPDDFAEEAFTVYDHPKVLIFKNERKSQ